MRAEALAALDAAQCPVADADTVAADLIDLRALLEKWQKVQNLVARDTLPDFWTRHVADSLQIGRLLPVGARRIVDLGSGGGFPALPLAIALKPSGVRWTLIESNGRKVAFLRAAVRALHLDAEIVDSRIEEFVSRETQRPEVITARALAPLTDLCRFSAPLWTPRTIGLFHKGREHVEEIRESSAHWRHDVVIHSSIVDRSGVIVEVRNLRPATG